MVVINYNLLFTFIAGALILMFISCGENHQDNFTYDPSPYLVEIPDNYPLLKVPDDNPLTIKGVELGRHLFYDPIISHGKGFSCSNCHLVSASFSDIQDIPGMAIYPQLKMMYWLPFQNYMEIGEL